MFSNTQTEILTFHPLLHKYQTWIQIFIDMVKLCGVQLMYAEHYNNGRIMAPGRNEAQHKLLKQATNLYQAFYRPATVSYVISKGAYFFFSFHA